jgi:hypothetical protein
LGNLGEVAVGTAVDIGDRNNVRSRSQGLHDIGRCGRSG